MKTRPPLLAPSSDEEYALSCPTRSCIPFLFNAFGTLYTLTGTTAHNNPFGFKWLRTLSRHNRGIGHLFPFWLAQSDSCEGFTLLAPRFEGNSRHLRRSMSIPPAPIRPGSLAESPIKGQSPTLV